MKDNYDPILRNPYDPNKSMRPDVTVGDAFSNGVSAVNEGMNSVGNLVNQGRDALNKRSNDFANNVDENIANFGRDASNNGIPATLGKAAGTGVRYFNRGAKQTGQELAGIVGELANNGGQFIDSFNQNSGLKMSPMPKAITQPAQQPVQQPVRNGYNPNNPSNRVFDAGHGKTTLRTNGGEVTASNRGIKNMLSGRGKNNRYSQDYINYIAQSGGSLTDKYSGEKLVNNGYIIDNPYGYDDAQGKLKGQDVFSKQGERQAAVFEKRVTDAGQGGKQPVIIDGELLTPQEAKLAASGYNPTGEKRTMKIEKSTNPITNEDSTVRYLINSKGRRFEADTGKPWPNHSEIKDRYLAERNDLTKQIKKNGPSSEGIIQRLLRLDGYYYDTYSWNPRKFGFSPEKYLKSFN